MPIHHNLQFFNVELEWHPGDTQNLYYQNVLKKYDDLKRLGWINKKISYKFNSHGFRSEEFKEGKNIIFLGCSITFGTGINLEDTFPYKVAKSINYNCCNLGVSGSSNDTAFRLSEYWIPKINPDIVVLLSPEESRLELLSNNPTESIHYRINKESLKDSFYEKWVINEENGRLNRLKNQLSIQNICQSRNIKFLNFNVESDFCFTEKDLARDLSHPGVLSHHSFSEKILNFIHKED